MVFVFEEMKNIAMPSRHISPQSFDTILSELGDDPAIPDPHGIRKSSAPNAIHPEAQQQQKGRSPLESLNPAILGNQLQKFGMFIGVGVGLIGVLITLFIAFESVKSSSEILIQDSQKQISELQKELFLLRTELQTSQDELYDEIDLLEVSIHSLKKNKAHSKEKPRPQATPHESELKNWRFLGTAQIRGSSQAFFHTGNRNVVFEKDALVLGDWRLTQIEKELVALTHPLGKTLLLKPSKPD
jgi:hypothetical protein